MSSLVTWLLVKTEYGPGVEVTVNHKFHELFALLARSRIPCTNRTSVQFESCHYISTNPDYTFCI